MRPRLHPAWSAAAGLGAALLLGACELALHEVQQARTGGCDPWLAGCPARVEYTDGEPVHPARIDIDRLTILDAAIDAPYRRCDGIGLVCQGRIIGDVLWDDYVMVLARRSHTTSTAASARRVFPAAGAEPPARAATAPAAAQPAHAPGRIVRTHGSRPGEAVTAAPGR